MAKTYQNLIEEARELLQDSDSATERFSNATLLNLLNRGLNQLARIRPDAFYDLYDANDLNVPEIVEAAPAEGQVEWTDAFPLELQFYSPLISYIVGVAEMYDDEYTEDGRAAMALTMFRNTVLGL